MEPGDVAPVETGECTDIYYIETGMYDVNGYGAVYAIDGDRPAIVDTGIGTNHERVLDGLAEVGIGREDLEVIATTHVHLDHAGGAGHIAAKCPNATVYVHGIGAPHLVDPTKLVEGTKAAVGEQWQYYVEPKPVPEERVEEIDDGDAIDLGDRELIAHHAPGHAPHQVVFELPSDDAVFCADAAGIYVPDLDRVVETSPPAAFDLDEVLDDVETIRRLDPGTLLYPHFGPAPTDGRLDEYERVITDWFETVKATREELGDDDAIVDALLEETDEELIDVWGEHKARPEREMNIRGVLIALDRAD